MTARYISPALRTRMYSVRFFVGFLGCRRRSPARRDTVRTHRQPRRRDARAGRVRGDHARLRPVLPRPPGGIGASPVGAGGRCRSRSRRIAGPDRRRFANRPVRDQIGWHEASLPPCPLASPRLRRIGPRAAAPDPALRPRSRGSGADRGLSERDSQPEGALPPGRPERAHQPGHRLAGAPRPDAVPIRPARPLLLVAGHGLVVFHDAQLNQTSNIPSRRTPLGILLADRVRLSGDVTVTSLQRQPGRSR